MDVVSAEELVEAVHALCLGQPHPILVDSRDVAGLVTPKAREYMKSAPKMIRSRKAEAFIVDSLANKLLISFYIRVNKPSTPAKVFTNEPDAVEWLKQFL